MIHAPGMEESRTHHTPDARGDDGWLLDGIWPEEWEGWRVPEEVFARAYDGVSPEQRAGIKTVLALVQAVHGEEATFSEQRVIRSGTGFGWSRRTVPAPWALLILEQRTFSAIHTAAAVMPAHLAGVRHLAALWMGESPVPATVAATLELSGVENAFVLPPLADLKSVLAGLIMHFEKMAKGPHVAPSLHPAQNRPGRLLFPGNGMAVPQERSSFHARLAVPVWEENAARNGSVSLSLAPELAGLWVHPDLPPSFFLNTEMTLFPTGTHTIVS